MAEMLVDIFSMARPKLSVMDGIVGMEENGPLDGRVKKISVIMASVDSVALDAVASAVVNFDPLEVPTTRIAANRDLGVADLKKIEIVGESIEKVRVKDFKRPTRLGS